MSIRSQRIIYTKLMYSSTNIAGAELVPSNGTFISAYPGSYTVTWSLQTDVGDVEKGVELYLRKNKEKVPYSIYLTSYTGGRGVVWDQGGRTLVLHLDRGDTLDLFCVDCSGGINHVTFCASLSSCDVE